MITHRFFMEHMEKCMGGEHPDFAFDLSSYEPRMLEYDAEVEAELSQPVSKVCAPDGSALAYDAEV